MNFSHKNSFDAVSLRVEFRACLKQQTAPHLGVDYWGRRPQLNDAGLAVNFERHLNNSDDFGRIVAFRFASSR